MSHVESSKSFFELCETGAGAEAVAHLVAPNATFACDGLPEITTLVDYVNWMKSVATEKLPGCSYKINSVTTNENSAVFYATFYATAGDKNCVSRYVYIIESADGKIVSLVKVWDKGNAFGQLGW